MHLFRPGIRLRLIGLGLALCTVAWASAACAPTANTPPATTAPTQVSTPTADLTANTAVGSDKAYSQDPGASTAVSPAAGKARHFMGDPKAPVVLVEISDFQ